MQDAEANGFTLTPSFFFKIVSSLTANGHKEHIGTGKKKILYPLPGDGVSRQSTWVRGDLVTTLPLKFWKSSCLFGFETLCVC